MIKYIITKEGREFQAYGSCARHEDIIKDNGLSFNDVLEEGIIEGKDRIIVSSKENKGEAIPKNVLRARVAESLYMYGYNKEGD